MSFCKRSIFKDCRVDNKCHCQCLSMCHYIVQPVNLYRIPKSNLRASLLFLAYSKKQGVNMKGFGFSICLALLILFATQQALSGCTEWSEWTSCRDGGQGRQRSCAGLKVGSKSFTSAVRGCSPQGCGACPGIPGYCSSSNGLRYDLFPS